MLDEDWMKCSSLSHTYKFAHTHQRDILFDRNVERLRPSVWGKRSQRVDYQHVLTFTSSNNGAWSSATFWLFINDVFVTATVLRFNTGLPNE